MSESGLTPRFRWQLGIRDSRDLSKAAKHVGFDLSLHMDAEGGSCRPGVRLVSEETGLSSDTVTSGINELLEKGWLLEVEPAIGSRPRLLAARLDCVPPIRTQKSRSVPSSRTQGGDVASDFSAVASESADGCVRNDGTKGFKRKRGGPATARSRDDAEKRRRIAIAEVTNIGHLYEESDLRKLLADGGIVGEEQEPYVEAARRRNWSDER